MFLTVACAVRRPVAGSAEKKYESTYAAGRTSSVTPYQIPLWFRLEPARFLSDLFRQGTFVMFSPSISSPVGFTPRTASRFSPPRRTSSVTSKENGTSPPSFSPSFLPLSHTVAL